MEQGTPQIPSLKQTQKKPGGMGGLAPGLSFIERLNQFKRKDLAFITAGLSVLFMAPVAEHFLMNPDAASTGAMTPGWDMKKGAGFGDGSSPYESGVNGLAPGGVTGGGDVITPLNVRDPASLILGPGASSQPPATATTPAPPPKNDTGDWKDAIANAGSAAAKKAVEKAGLPVPKPSLSNAGLRGLGAVSGGGGGSYALPPVSAGLAPNKAAESNSLQRVQAPPGFRGVGRRGGENASAGSMESLKKAAAGAVDAMNRRGSASSAAEQAASLSMGGGSSGGGAGAGGPDGPADKASGGSQNKDSSNVGESLDFMRRKAEQDKAIDLQWKLKEKDAMLLPNLKEKALDTLSMGLLKGVVDKATLQMKLWGSNVGGGTTWKCKGAGEPIPGNIVGECSKANSDPNYKNGLMYLRERAPDGTYTFYDAPTGCLPHARRFSECRPAKEGSDAGSQGPDPDKVPPGSLIGAGPRSHKTLEGMCKDLPQLVQAAPEVTNASEGAKLVAQVKGIIARVSEAQANLTGNRDQLFCGGEWFVEGEGNIKTILERLRRDLLESANSFDNVLKLLQGVNKTVMEETPSVTQDIDRFLTQYLSNPQSSPDSLAQAATRAKDYASVYDKANAPLKQKDKEASEVDAEFERGAKFEGRDKPLEGLGKELSGIENSLSKTDGSLASAQKSVEAVRSQLNASLTAQGFNVTEIRNWVEDLAEHAAKIRQEGYEPSKAEAERAKKAHARAVEASALDPQKRPVGPVPVSIQGAKDLVGSEQDQKTLSLKNLGKWAVEEIKPGGNVQVVKDQLNMNSGRIEKQAKKQFEDSVPGKAVDNIRVELGEAR